MTKNKNRETSFRERYLSCIVTRICRLSDCLPSYLFAYLPAGLMGLFLDQVAWSQRYRKHGLAIVA